MAARASLSTTDECISEFVVSARSRGESVVEGLLFIVVDLEATAEVWVF
jgi:hypothetical protein